MNELAIRKQAQLAVEEKRYGDAERLYLDLFDCGFETEDTLGALAKLAILLGSLKRATEYLYKLFRLYPATVAYREALVDLYRRQNNWSMAATVYAQAIDYEPNSPDVYFNCAFCFKQAGQYQRAIDHYQAALDLDISSPESVLTNMAVIYSEHLRLESKAVACLQRALVLMPDYLPALFNLASLYEEQGLKNQAVELYNRVLKLKPDDYSSMLRLAYMTTAVSTDEPIIKTIENALGNGAIELQSQIDLNFSMGKLLDDCGEFGRAFSCYENGNVLDCQSGQTYRPLDQENFTTESIAAFNSEWFSSVKQVSSESPVFICGMFRSGSTLVEQILASHSKITAGGERNYFVSLNAENDNGLLNLVAQLSDQQLQVMAGDYLNDLSRAFPNSNIVTDKRPDNFLYLGLIKTLFPNAKIIHTQRHYLDNFLSIYFLRADSSMSYAKDLKSIEHYYGEYQRLMAHWQSVFPNNIHSISYDDLVSEPVDEIRAMLHFLGLEWEPACLDFHQLGNRVKTASIWQTREPLYQRSSGRWQNYQGNLSELIKM